MARIFLDIITSSI